MPSKSPAQARLMAAAAHTPGGYGGVPQSVGRDFNQADKGTGILKGPRKVRTPVHVGVKKVHVGAKKARVKEITYKSVKMPHSPSAKMLGLDQSPEHPLLFGR